MARETVKTYDDVLESVRAFNKALEQSKRLREHIRFLRIIKRRIHDKCRQ
jgi:hypothetical protein